MSSLSDVPIPARRSVAIAGTPNLATPPTSDIGDAARRRRLKFRCWHRGMKEVDLILGRFADAAVDEMDAHDLRRLEAFLDLPDPQILAWITGEEPPPSGAPGVVVHQLIAFHR